MTQEMIDYIRTTQIDSSKQTLDLASANVTGDLFDIGDRTAAFAAGVEHRKYRGEFNPDPLRQTGESQDSFASPVKAEYDVSEIYSEFSFPVLASLDLTAAIRYSDYSTFGNATTGKAGFRWQPIEDLVIRGTYSEGFRAPNLGELFGLTQFGATLVDPCGSTGSPGPGFAGIRGGLPGAGRAAELRAGQHPDHHLHRRQPEPRTRRVRQLHLRRGLQPGLGRRHCLVGSLRCRAELLQPRDRRRHPGRATCSRCCDTCLREGGVGTINCTPFSRNPIGGNLNPPNNFLDNLGTIKTDGLDIKANWTGPEWSWGRLTASLQSTLRHGLRGDRHRRQQFAARSRHRSGRQRDPGLADQRAVGLDAGRLERQLDRRATSPRSTSPAATCRSTRRRVARAASQFNTLGSTTYHDLQVELERRVCARRPEAVGRRQQRLRQGTAGVPDLLA